MLILGLRQKSREQRAKETTDVGWADLILAELKGGSVKSTFRIAAARSRVRGRIDIEANKSSRRAADLGLADVARRRD